MKPAPQAPPDVDLLYPLSLFCGNAGHPLPTCETVEGDAVPEPYCGLLVHRGDMTSRLEAFHHGSIVLEAWRQDDKLYVGVLDDGVGLAKAPQEGQGLGLSVTRERIAGLHPEGSSGFSIHPRPEGGTAVEISFPLRWEGT